MGYQFTEIGKSLNKIAQLLNSDTELRRLLKYMQNDPLSSDYEDYPQSQSLVNTNIRILPKISPSEVTEAFICIQIPNLVTDTNLDFTNLTFSIDVFCPIDKWLIDDIVPRPFKIMDRIYSLLDGSRVTGIGTMRFQGASQSVVYEGLTDHHMTFEVTANG